MPQLRRALSDSRLDVRVMAAYGIGKIGPDARSCVPDLLKMMGSEQCPALPLARISASNLTGAKLAVEALVAVLRDDRRTWQDRENAVKGLAILGRHAVSALGPLRSTVEEIHASNACVRVAAEEAICKITTP